MKYLGSKLTQFENNVEINTKTGNPLEVKVNGVTKTTITASGEVNATDVKVNGNSVWHAGNMDFTGYSGQIKDVLQLDPVPPTDLILVESGDKVEVCFTPPIDKTIINSYEVWSSVGGETDYGLIASIDPDVIGETVTVLDDTYMKKDTIYYKVFALSNGVKSPPLEGNITVSGNAADPSNLSIIPQPSSFIIQYNIPDDRRISHIEIYKDANEISGSLSESNSSLIYSGNSNTYTYKIPLSDYEKFHKFWVKSITRS